MGIGSSGRVSVAPFTSFAGDVPALLDRAGLAPLLGGHDQVLLKPNLVNSAPPPITTPVEFVRQVALFVRQHSDAEIIVGEGCGDTLLETDEIFAELGYDRLASELGLTLLDLNYADLTCRSDSFAVVFPEMHLPKILFESFVISLPVLKAHSLSIVTGALKNMIGCAPPEHYQGVHGMWKKAMFHGRMQQSIRDLISYRRPDFAVMDASVGMAEYHLGGPKCDPPIGRLLASADPLALDREACGLLGIDWRSVGHLR